jgi:hypothetical protein
MQRGCFERTEFLNHLDWRNRCCRNLQPEWMFRRANLIQLSRGKEKLPPGPMSFLSY